MTLTGDDIGLLASLIGVPTTILGWYLRSMRMELTRNSQSIERYRMEVDQRLRALEEKKTDKQAWMRETINTGAKIDHVSEQIAEMRGRFDSEFGVAAAIHKLADSMNERNAER